MMVEGQHKPLACGGNIEIFANRSRQKLIDFAVS